MPPSDTEDTPSPPSTVLGVRFHPRIVFGLPIAKPELAPIIRTIFLLALAPILLVAVFAAVTLTLGTPVFFWYYVVFVTTILAPAALYYGVQYNKSGALELYAVCNVALAVLQAVGIWQIVRFLDQSELFLQQCAVKNGLIVPAVANPDFDCQSYHSYEYWKSSNTVANADRTLVIYSVLMGLAIIIHSALMALSIFLYKKLAGSRTLVLAPTFSEGQMRPVDAAVAEGTEASDSAKVTTGVPVKRSESSLCEVDMEAGEVEGMFCVDSGILSLFLTPMFGGAPEKSHNTKSSSQLVEVVGIDMVERSYARRVGGFIFLTYLPPFINLTFMVVAVVLSIPLTNLSDFLTLVSPFLPLLAYYGFVLVSPKMMLTYGALVWIMIGLRALALAQMFHYVSLVQRLVASCTIDGAGKVIDAVSHPVYDCGKISSSVWEVAADHHAHNSGNIYAIYLTCFFMEVAVYLVLGVLAVRFSMLTRRGKVVKKSAEVDASGIPYDRQLVRMDTCATQCSEADLVQVGIPVAEIRRGGSIVAVVRFTICEISLLAMRSVPTLRGHAFIQLRKFSRTSNVTAKIQKRREEFVKEKFPYFRGAVTEEMPKRGRKSGGHFLDPSMDPLNLDGDDSVHDSYMKRRMDEIDGDFVDNLVREGKTGGDMFQTFEAHLSAIADFKATKVAAASQRESHIKKITQVEYNPLHGESGKARLMEATVPPSYALEDGRGRRLLPAEQHASLQPRGKAVNGRFISGKRSRDKKSDPRFSTPDTRSASAPRIDEQWMMQQQQEDKEDENELSDEGEGEDVSLIDEDEDELRPSREEEFSDEDSDDDDGDRFERPYEEKGVVVGEHGLITSSIAMTHNFKSLRANDGEAFPVNVDTESPYGGRMRASGLGQVWRELSKLGTWPPLTEEVDGLFRPEVRFGEYLETAVPLTHTTTLGEYRRARTDAVVADESYKQLYWITGEDRQMVADHFLTTGLRNMTPGDVQFSCIIDTRALVLDLCHVYVHPDAVAILTEGHARPQLYDYLCQYVLYSRQSGLDVRIQPVTLQAVLSVHGPGASIALAEMFQALPAARLETLNRVADPESDEALKLSPGAIIHQPFQSALEFHTDSASGVIIRGGSIGSGLDAFTLLLDVDADGASILRSLCTDHDVLPAGILAVDMLRNEAGLPRPGVDVTPLTSPIRASLAWTIDQYKLRLHTMFGWKQIFAQLGGGPRFGSGTGATFAVVGTIKLLSLRQQLSWFGEVRGHPRLDWELTRQITSCTWSPELKARICQAYIKPEFSKPGRNLLASVPYNLPDGMKYSKKKRLLSQGVFRGQYRRLTAARVYGLPFVEHTYPGAEGMKVVEFSKPDRDELVRKPHRVNGAVESKLVRQRDRRRNLKQMGRQRQQQHEDVSADIKYVMQHARKDGADASPSRQRKNTGLAHEVARADAASSLWSLLTEAEMLRMALLKLSLPAVGSGIVGAPLLSDTSLAFTEDLPELVLPSTPSVTTVDEYLDVCRENKSRSYPMRAIQGDELPLDLTDVDVKQDTKDMKRDIITVNGVLYEGAHVGYDGIVSAVQFALPQRIINAESIARVIISIANRTNSGGLCFEKVAEVYQQPDVVIIGPCSSVAEPLDVVITSDESSGVWAAIRAHTQYAVYSDGDHHELLRVDADFLCRLAIDVDYNGEADFGRHMPVLQHAGTKQTLVPPGSPQGRNCLPVGSVGKQSKIDLPASNTTVAVESGSSTEFGVEHRVRNDGLTVESYHLHVDLTSAINSESELIGQYQNREFEGECRMVTRHATSISRIRLNAAELSIAKSEVVLVSRGERVAILHTTIPRPELEEIEIQLSRPIPGGSRCELRFQYSGRINSNSRGIYESEYLQRDPTCDTSVFTLRRGMIVTQCCPVDARRILPCVDEPDMKATFTVSVSAPRGVTVLGNMPVQRTEGFTYSRVSSLSDDSEDSIVAHAEDIEAGTSISGETPCGKESFEGRRRKHDSVTDCGSHTDQMSTAAEYAVSESSESADGMPSMKRRKVLEELCAGVRTTFKWGTDYTLAQAVPVGLRELEDMPTSKMSSYLLAFAVGDFVQLSGKDTPGRDPRVSVWCRRSQASKGSFALEIASKCLVYYESELFHTKYPLPKCDLLAVTDHHFGAMENWGLITFREQDLLITEDSGSAEAIYRITVTVCHELAHMWFGNIVTIKWWNDIWLNEGFATWTSYAAASYIFPDSSFWAAFQTSMVDRAMQLDCLESSHPIQVTCLDGREAFDNFDAISYNKSAAVIHMLTTHIGMARFKDRIHAYLDRHKYSSARTSDLWSCLGDEAVLVMMKTWTTQKGYPYLLADVVDENTVSIRQVAVGNSNTERQWLVPLRYRIISNNSNKHTIHSTTLLPNSDFKIALSSGDVLHLNPDTTGFYSVVYSPPLLHRITSLDPAMLSPLDLIGLIRDSTMAMTDGRLPPKEWYQLLLKFFSTGDIEDTVGIQLGNTLSHIFPILPRSREVPESRFREAYGKFCRILVGRYCATSTRSPDLLRSSPSDSLSPHVTNGIAGRGLRVGSLRIMLDCQDPATIEECSKLFEQGGYSLPDSVPEDIHGWVYAGAVACPKEGVARARLLLEHYENRHPASIDRQQKTLAIIGEVADVDIQRDILSLLLPKQVVRPQDWRCVVESCTHNRSLGLGVVWEWLTTWWKQIQERFRSSGAMGIGSKLLVLVCENMSTEEDLARVLKFLRANPDPRMARTTSQLIDRIKRNIALRASLEGSVAELETLVDEYTTKLDGNRQCLQSGKGVEAVSFNTWPISAYRDKGCVRTRGQ
ncbi:hypothetical protein FOL46_000403, partial [Perkinsus olseni]